MSLLPLCGLRSSPFDYAQGRMGGICSALNGTTTQSVALLRPSKVMPDTSLETDAGGAHARVAPAPPPVFRAKTPLMFAESGSVPNNAYLADLY
jgi:hypothetical protein